MPKAEIQARDVYWDVIRIVLIAQVVVGHVGTLAFPGLESIEKGTLDYYATTFVRSLFRFGEEAAYVFVILSGYFAGGAFDQKSRCGTIQWGDLFRRLKKVLPVIFVAVLITILSDRIGFLSDLSRAFYSENPFYDFTAELTATNALATLFSTQPVLGSPIGSNGPLWTLGYIVQFYVLGFFAFKWIKGQLVRLAACSVLCLCMSAVSIEWGALFAAWLLGAYLKRLVVPTSIYWMPAFAVFFVGANLMPAQFLSIVMSMAGFVVLMFARFNVSMFSSLLQYVSGFSFQLYGYHFPIATLAIAILSHFYSNFICFLIGISLSIFVSLILTELEQRARSLFESSKACRA